MQIILITITPPCDVQIYGDDRLHLGEFDDRTRRDAVKVQVRIELPYEPYRYPVGSQGKNE